MLTRYERTMRWSSAHWCSQRCRHSQSLSSFRLSHMGEQSLELTKDSIFFQLTICLLFIVFVSIDSEWILKSQNALVWIQAISSLYSDLNFLDSYICIHKGCALNNNLILAVSDYVQTSKPEQIRATPRIILAYIYHHCTVLRHHYAYML